MKKPIFSFFLNCKMVEPGSLLTVFLNVRVCSRTYFCMSHPARPGQRLKCQIKTFSLEIFLNLQKRWKRRTNLNHSTPYSKRKFSNCRGRCSCRIDTTWIDYLRWIYQTYSQFQKKTNLDEDLASRAARCSSTKE